MTRSVMLVGSGHTKKWRCARFLWTAFGRSLSPEWSSLRDQRCAGEQESRADEVWETPFQSRVLQATDTVPHALAVPLRDSMA